MNKLIFVLILVIGMIIIIGVVNYFSDYHKPKPTLNKLYQGAVPLGYDLEHFRETGQSIPLK